MVNSAYYGLRHPAESVAKAIVYLGMKNLRNVVMLDAIRGSFLSTSGGSSFSSERLFLHATAVGTCAQLVARRIYGLPGEDAFLAGILHDIGLMIEAQVRPDQLQQAVDRFVAGDGGLPVLEHSVIGTDHCEIGAFLAESWQFPPEIGEVIRCHHEEPARMEELGQTRGFVLIAEHIAAASGYEEFEGKVEAPGKLLESHFHDRSEDYRLLAETFAEEMKKAEALFQN
jgi:putative nucleotidyltransferase with HDIG domain